MSRRSTAAPGRLGSEGQGQGAARLTSSSVDTQQLAHALGLATGRRELAERLVGELRKSAANWRVAESKSTGLFGAFRTAFLWALTERWCSRLEALAAQAEADLAELRTAEQSARAAYERALQAVPPMRVVRKARK